METPPSPEVQIQDVIDELHRLQEDVQVLLAIASDNPSEAEAEEIARLTRIDEQLITLFVELDKLDEEDGQQLMADLARRILETEFPGHKEWPGLEGK